MSKLLRYPLTDAREHKFKARVSPDGVSILDFVTENGIFLDVNTIFHIIWATTIERSGTRIIFSVFT